MTTSTATSYDLVPYESFPFPQTHPDRLAALGRLFGLSPPPLARCRVLELGCAAGGNLIPMALALPEAECIGVDLSAVQVADGQAAIEALGLGNVRLLAKSITEVDESFGTFDYILCHGVYSWVPNAVQEKILAIVARQLSEQGIAYLSYNTLPGWRMRGMIRDLMRYHAMRFEEPSARVAQARAILDFLAKWVPTEGNAYGILLKSELEGLRRAPDYYILHEHLEDINEPLYFHELMERARAHGLQYLAEADFSTMLASNFPKEAADTLWRIAPDLIRQEQFMDFLRNRTFRQTLLVHEAVRIDRALTPERITGLWVSSPLRAVSLTPDLGGEAVEEFRAPSGGSLRTPNPVTKAAVGVLAEHWPACLGFGELLAQAQARLPATQPDGESVLASDLLQCYASGLIELHAGPSPFVVRAGKRPLASPLARWQAKQGRAALTNLRHEVVNVDANLARLLSLLDGRRSQEEIREKVTDWLAEGAEGKGRRRRELGGLVRGRVDEALAQLGRAALLLG